MLQSRWFCRIFDGEPASTSPENALARSGRRRQRQEIRARRSQPLELDRAAILQLIARAETPRRLVRHLDAAGRAGALQPAGRVDRIAPQIVAEFVLADDAGADRPGMDADPQV